LIEVTESYTPQKKIPPILPIMQIVHITNFHVVFLLYCILLFIFSSNINLFLKFL